VIQYNKEEEEEEEREKDKSNIRVLSSTHN
jgi:hypothetical protein